MAQTYYPTFNSSEVVQDTMAHIMEDNGDAVRSKFSGITDPTEKIAFQWWMDTTPTSETLKILNAGLTWVSVYDMANEQIIIQDGQIDTLQIANTARKGTIVETEDISPATCAIRTKASGGTLVFMPQDLFVKVATLGDITVPSGAWDPISTSKIYVPADQETLYLLTRQSTCSIRFTVGAVTSTATGDVVGPAWATEISADVSALSGWQDFVIQGNSTEGGAPYGGLSGVTSRWGE
jgi:hypothetical protein